MSNPTDRPFDVGLQAERTALAWQRTTLSFGIATLVAARLTANVFGMASFVVAAAGVVLMVAVLFVSHRRYRLIHTRLTEATNARVPLASAVSLGFYALAAFALGFVGLVVAIAVP